ncbi:MAG: hydantoinase/oxoprolinase family protein [Planctomycetota bacterium]|jgi:N-methylhydantoinase A
MDESYRIGVDVGGTFTDLFLWTSGGTVETFKVLSTPADPSIGVLDGLETVAAARGTDLATLARRIATIVHGTTVTTNAVLTRSGARTGLITTEGVRDALEMRRGIREERYDNRLRNVVPLVPRHRRLPVAGRLDHAGQELTALDLEGVRAAARRFRADGVTAVAVCLMNAFANPAHERAALETIRGQLDAAFVCASTDVLPVVRFYNRVSTTVLNAYVGPVLGDYLRSLLAKLADIGFDGVLLVMQSNGGVALPDVTLQRPATTLLSGPAAGPRAATAFTEPHGERDCILVDMGGTSFDASLVRDGAAAVATEGEIARLRIALPMLDIATIGAGGGSIGWIDEGGLLRMGPQSAGADPGPACYGRGGELPACTDADLVLGYLDPDFFAGGKLRLDAARARHAIEERVAKPLGLDLVEAAAGMYRVINANMAHGVREITVKRGLDPREFPLVVAGGAGALHACMIANELEIPTVLVPAAASVLCAGGMLFSDLQHDYVRTLISPFASLEPFRLEALAAEMVEQGADQLRQEGVAGSDMEHAVALDLRYLRQYHEVTLPVPRETIARADVDAVARAFHAEHNRLYGYDLAAEGTDIELINVRVRSVGRTPKPPLPRLPEGGADPAPALKGRRRAYVPEQGAFAEVPVYDGHRLKSGNIIEGPALVERIDTTIFVSDDFVARTDGHGSCHLARRAGEEAA